MSELEERVARALYELPMFTSSSDADWSEFYGRPDWEHLKAGDDAQRGVHTGEPDKDDYINAARVILRIVAEPTK